MALFGGYMLWMISIGFLVAIQLSRGGVPSEMRKYSRVELGDIKGISREEMVLYDAGIEYEC